METVILKSRQMLNLEPATQQSHPRLSLFRVLHVKILRWIDGATANEATRAMKRALLFTFLIFAIFAPQFLLGAVLASFRWNGARIPLFCVVLAMTLNAKRVWLAWRRRSTRTRGANQHTYHGLPVSAFASFLLKSEGFTFEDATKQLAFPERQYRKIADELEKHGILIRGENNARVLRPITLEQLVTQLRDNFPLMWDERHDEWTDKEDAYGRHLRAEGFRTRKLTEAVEKRERKLARIEKKIEERTEELASPFARIMAT